MNMKEVKGAPTRLISYLFSFSLPFSNLYIWTDLTPMCRAQLCFRLWNQIKKNILSPKSSLPTESQVKDATHPSLTLSLTSFSSSVSHMIEVGPFCVSLFLCL